MSDRLLSEEDLALGMARASGPCLPPDEGMRVAEDVARAYRVSVKELLGRGRTAHVARARKDLYVALYRQLGWSFARVGRFVDRDHTTVMFAIREAEVE